MRQILQIQVGDTLTYIEQGKEHTSNVLEVGYPGITSSGYCAPPAAWVDLNGRAHAILMTDIIRVKERNSEGSLPSARKLPNLAPIWKEAIERNLDESTYNSTGHILFCDFHNPGTYNVTNTTNHLRYIYLPEVWVEWALRQLNIPNSGWSIALRLMSWRQALTHVPAIKNKEYYQKTEEAGVIVTKDNGTYTVFAPDDPSRCMQGLPKNQIDRALKILGIADSQWM